MKEFIKKRKKVLIVLAVLLLLIATGGFIFKKCYSTYPGYNDCFIIGNTMENIQEKYGEFDRINYTRPGSEHLVIGKYCVKKGVSDWDWYLGHLNAPVDMYYCIAFDENEIAREVYVDGVA